MRKQRSSTPCLGICSTTYGDDVCRGCKRFIHEVINWNSYSNDEKEIVNSRLEEFKMTILSHRFKVTDAELLSSKLKEHAINFNDALDPITWIFDLSMDLSPKVFPCFLHCEWHEELLIYSQEEGQVGRVRASSSAFFKNLFTTSAPDVA